MFKNIWNSNIIDFVYFTGIKAASGYNLSFFIFKIQEDFIAKNKKKTPGSNTSKVLDS